MEPTGSHGHCFRDLAQLSCSKRCKESLVPFQVCASFESNHYVASVCSALALHWVQKETEECRAFPPSFLKHHDSVPLAVLQPFSCLRVGSLPGPSNQHGLVSWAIYPAAAGLCGLIPASVIPSRSKYKDPRKVYLVTKGQHKTSLL